MHSLNDYSELIVRVLAGDATNDEEKALQLWINASSDNRKYFEDLHTLWRESEKLTPLVNSDLKDDWKKTRAKIRRIQESEIVPNRPSHTRYVLMRIAATVLLFVGFCYLISRFYQPRTDVVTLSSIKTVTLPDGSKVILNVNSTLSYPEEFATGARMVSLKGEAFFDIRRDVRRPFMIKTGNATTEVLGTSFSVKAQADSVVVTVVTGRVLLYEKKENSIVLTPGERGLSFKGTLSERKNADVNFLSWQTHTLDFSNATVATFAHDVTRQFKVPVVIRSEQLKTCTITAQFKNQSLKQILDELQLLFPVSITMRGDSVIVEGKGCESPDQ
jgi:transmembrane sensor